MSNQNACPKTIGVGAEEHTTFFCGYFDVEVEVEVEVEVDGARAQATVEMRHRYFSEVSSLKQVCDFKARTNFE